MKAVFSRQFRDDLAREEGRYGEISGRLAGAFRERVAGQTREIIRWSGGDHVGPHGFPCRRMKPFSFYIYYQVQGLFPRFGPRTPACRFSEKVDGGGTQTEAEILSIGRSTLPIIGPLQM